jgi:L-2-hydroxyglutarate oxidase
VDGEENIYDYVIIGGGIVGLSTARQLLLAEPGKRLLLLEKESSFAHHQTGRNSGVIHAGIYYAPGSLKAKFCREGVEATIQFCQKHDIPYEQCGKLIVATNNIEYQRMLDLYHRGLENKMELELLDAQQLRELEPNISGVGAILLKTTGIVDYTAVCEKMAEEIHELGGRTMLESEVTALKEDDEVVSVKLRDSREFSTRFLVACSGLMADRTARMLNIPIDFKVVPYRGEYFQLPPAMNNIVSHLIYPVPNPDLPFLGVHLTRMIDGSVTVGPNAVQGWKREGYGRINISLRDMWDLLTFPGFWKVTLANLRPGLSEFKNSVWRRGYLKLVQKYCPQITLDDLQPYPAGVRAQAVMNDGTLVQDFLFAESPRSLHVCNAPSPAATSSIPIGEYICETIFSKQEFRDD